MIDVPAQIKNDYGLFPLIFPVNNPLKNAYKPIIKSIGGIFYSL